MTWKHVVQRADATDAHRGKTVRVMCWFAWVAIECSMLGVSALMLCLHVRFSLLQVQI